MNIWLAEIWKAWRASLRKPGFLLLAVAVLGLGVGASAAVFTLVNDVVLRPLPFAHSDRLAAIGLGLGSHEPIVLPRQYQHLKSLQGVASMGFLGVGAVPVNALTNGVPQRAGVVHADRHLLPVLGVHVAIGHNFTAREDQPHGPSVAILGHGYWEREYGGNAGAIGKQIEIKGVAHTIVGVLPARFDRFCARFLDGCDVVLPAALSPSGAGSALVGLAIARLAPGVTTHAVEAQVRARMQQLYGASTGPMARQAKSSKFAVSDLATALHVHSRWVLRLYMGSALFVLLIAWVNLTNLLFLRSLSRHHESAVREALGALGLRRHLPAFAESLLAGVLGGVLGVGLAALGLSVLRHFAPAAWLASAGLHVGVSTWLFGLAAAVVAALSATLLGLWKGRRAQLATQLHEGGRSGADPRMGYVGRALVVVQVALATVLLVGAGLFVHGLVNASQVELGFNPRGVLTFQIAPVKTRYPDADSVLALGKQIRRRLAAQPGVVGADVATALPSGGGMFAFGLHVGSGKPFRAHFNAVDADYFATFEISVLKGRAFTRMDRRGGARVAVVNAAFARQHFGGHALGKTLRLGGAKPTTLRVVGVVGNTRQSGPLRPALPILYVPWDQVSAPRLAGALHFMLRVRGNPDDYRRTVRAVMAKVAPMQPIARMGTLQSLVAKSLSQTWRILLLVGLFAALALLLAAAGIYAVMAVVVASREHEFGVRSALGAPPARLVRLVLGGGLAQIGIGLVAGLIAAVLLSGTLQARLALIGRSNALDPWAIVGVCVVLALAGALACLRPALRAGRVQPMHALRGE